MVQDFWEDGSLSIVLLPSGQQGEGLLDLSRQWTELHFLGAALWVRPEDVVRIEGQPPRITAAVFGPGGESDVTSVRHDLFHMLARQSLRLVRLVTVRSVVPDRELDAVQDGIVSLVSEYVRHSVPLESAGTTVAKIRNDLTRITLICAPTEYQLTERVGWVTGDDSVTLIASPEDRVTPWAGDAFVRADEKFPGFVLMHAATAAGLWNGLPVGLPELINRDRSSAAGNVWVSRVFVSGVMTEGLAERASMDVLRQASDPTSHVVDPYSGVLADGTSAIPSEQVDGYREAMVDTAMAADNDTLHYAPPRNQQDRERDRVSIFEQLRRFMVFCGSVMANAPSAYWRYIRNGFARMIGRRLQGEDGMLVVGGEIDGLDSQDRALARSLERLHAEQGRVSEELSQPVPRFSVRSTPRLWAHLREAVFGSLDGSGELTDRGFSEVEGRIPVFGRVADVIHDPHDVWPVPRGARQDGVPDAIGPLDWSAQKQMRTRIDAEVQECRGIRDEAQTALGAVELEAAQLEYRHNELQELLLDAKELRITEEGDVIVSRAKRKDREGIEPVDPALVEEYKEIAPRLKLLEKQRPVLEKKVAAGQARVDNVAILDDDYSAWEGRQGANFGSHLLGRIGDERDRAASEARALQAEVDTLRIPEPGTLARLRDQYYGRWALTLGIVLALAALLIVPDVWGDRDRLFTWWPDWWWTATAGVIALIVIGIILFISYYRQWSRFNRSVIETEARLNRVNDRATHALREEYRLGSLLDQTAAWLDLLARGLRKPWKAKESWKPRDPQTLNADALPFALRIARAAHVGTETPRRLQRAVAEALVRRGWRASVFDEMLEAIRETESLDARSIGLDALDNDLPHLPNHAREILRETMGRDDVLEAVAQKRLEALERQVEFESLYGAATQVQPLVSDPLAVLRGGGATGAEVSWDAFLTAALGDIEDRATPLTPLAIMPYELQEGHHQDLRSFVLAPARLADQMRLANSPELQLRTYDDRSASEFDVIVRVDMAGPIPVDAVRLGLGQFGAIEGEYDGPGVQRCPICGRTNCPAADPTSGLPCDYAGV